MVHGCNRLRGIPFFVILEPCSQDNCNPNPSVVALFSRQDLFPVSLNEVVVRKMPEPVSEVIVRVFVSPTKSHRAAGDTLNVTKQ